MLEMGDQAESVRKDSLFSHNIEGVYSAPLSLCRLTDWSHSPLIFLHNHFSIYSYHYTIPVYSIFCSPSLFALHQHPFCHLILLSRTSILLSHLLPIFLSFNLHKSCYISNISSSNERSSTGIINFVFFFTHATCPAECFHYFYCFLRFPAAVVYY